MVDYYWECDYCEEYGWASTPSEVPKVCPVCGEVIDIVYEEEE